MASTFGTVCSSASVVFGLLVVVGRGIVAFVGIDVVGVVVVVRLFVIDVPARSSGDLRRNAHVSVHHVTRTNASAYTHTHTHSRTIYRSITITLTNT